MANSNPFLESPLDDLVSDLTPVASPKAAAAPKTSDLEPVSTVRRSAPSNDDLTKRAAELGVDPKLALSFFSQESSGNWNSRNSPKDARGGMQVMPDTYKMMMGTSAGQDNPWQNMEAGLRYIRYGQDKLGTKDVRLLAAGYHAGYDHPALRRGEIPGTNDGMISTRDYADSIYARYNGGKPAPASAKTASFADLQPITDPKELQKYGAPDFLSLSPVTDEAELTKLRPIVGDAEIDKQIALQQEKTDSMPFFDRATEAGQRGWNSMLQSLSTARWAIAGGDSERLAQDLEKKFAESGKVKKTTGQQEIDEAYKAVTDAKGAWNTTVAGLKALGTSAANPKDTAIEIVENAANSVPTLVTGAAGAGTGALAGAPAGPGGAVTGAIFGGRTGMAVGTTATELGSEVETMVQERLGALKQPPTAQNILAVLNDKKFQSDAMERGLKKGLTVAAVDQVFLKIGGKIAAAPARKAAQTGIAPSVGSRVAAGTGAVVVDATGETVGEAASQQVARGKVDAGEALREGVTSLGQSVAEVGVGTAIEKGKQFVAGAEPAPVQPQNRVEPTPDAPSQARGPLERATENAAADPERVKVSTPQGEVSGTVTGKAADGTTQIVGDDGQVYTFKVGENGVTMTPDAPNTPLSNALEVAADEVKAADNASTVAQNEAFNANQPAVGDIPAAPEAAAPAADAAVEPATSEPATSKPAAQAPDIKPVQTQTEPLDLTAMDEQTLRGRMRYITDQAKTNGGWNKMLSAERKRVSDEINKRQAALPQNTAPASAQVPVAADQTPPVIDAKSSQAVALPKELAGAKPRYSYGNKGFNLAFENDIDRAAFIVAQDKPSKRDADYLNFAMQATGMSEADVRAYGRSVRDAIKGMAKDASPGTLKVPTMKGGANVGQSEVSNSTQGGGAAVQPAAVPSQAPALPAGGRQSGAANNDRNAGADQQPAKLKPASKEDLDRLFGVDTKRAKALERIAAGKAWFNDGVKAKDFITKNGLKDTHEVVKGKGGRFEIQAKAAEAAQTTANKAKQDAMPREDFESKAGVGKISAVKERYSDKFGVSWASTDIASADTMEDAAAIAKAVAESGADNIADMREVAKNYRDQGVDNGNDNRTEGQRTGAEAVVQEANANEAEGAAVQSDAEPQATEEEVSGTTRAIEGAKRRLRETRNELEKVSGGVTPSSQMKAAELRAKENAIEREIRDLRSKAAQEIEVGAPLPNATAPEEKIPEPDWWKDSTPNDRYRRLRASGIRGTAQTPWNRLNAADQRALNEQWGGQNDELDAEMRSYEAKAEAAQAVSPLTQARNDLIDTNTRIEQQGRVVDDRLLERKRQQEKLIADLESEQNLAETPDASAELMDRIVKAYGFTDLGEMPAGIAKTAEKLQKALVKRDQNLLEQILHPSNPNSRKAFTNLFGGKMDLPKGVNATNTVIAEFLGKVNEQVAAEAAPAETPAQFANNKIFTQSAVDKARARLKSKLSQLNSGIDPEMMIDGMTIAGAYIEAGVREFSAYAKAMTEDFGDRIKPYLLSFYEGARNYPGIDTEGMTPQDQAKKLADALTAAPATENDNEPEALDEPGARALEGTPADLLSGLEPDGQAGRGAEGSGREDAPGDVGARVGRVQQSGSMGDGARDVPVPAGRTRKGRGGQQGGGAVQRGERAQQPDLADVGGNRELEPAAGQRAQDRSSDFVITDEDAIGEGGAKTKFRNNMAAIRLLKQLQAEDRAATRAEQAVLAKYVGWGGIPQAFGRDNSEVSKGWDKEVAELKEALTADELAAAASSTRNAHYTSPEIVQSMWSIAKRFGFQGGRVLEPSVGSGNFFGLMPTDLRSASQMTGVELDRITGGIAQKLYPQANIAAPVGFQDFSAPDNYFDLAIGNPPFGREGIYDATRRKISGFSIHNYFFAKSIDTVKPNGVLAMVVTNRLLDSVGDKARQYIADRSEFLGAIRLPNDAFMANAGTAVTTDIIFLRKLKDGEQPKGERWMDVKQYTDKDGKQVPLNEYFIRNPEMMLGDFGAYGSMYSPDDPALVAREGQDTPALMAEAINRLPQQFMDAPTAEPTRETISPSRDISSVKVGSVFEQGGQVFERREDMLNEQQAAPVTFASDKAKERVLGMIGVRDALVQVRSLQLSDTATDKQIEAARTELNKVYDAFVKANGPLNVDANKRLMRDDPSWPQIAALEDNFDKGISPAVAKSTGEKPRAPSARKAAIFTKRTQSPYQPPQKATSAKDALVTSLSERGRVDLDYMAGLYGKTPDAITKELGDLIYKNPVAGWETREQYLSGNVKKKLAEAIEAAKADPAMNANVEALRAVQPIDIEAVDIDVKVGAQWIPADVMEDFIRAVTEAGKAKAIYNPVNAQWTITADNVPASAQTQWSTDRVRVNAVLEAAANQKQIQVYDQHYDGTRTLNTAATTSANEKVERVKAEWKRWVWDNDARRDRLARIYNDTFNTDVSRDFDGSHLSFPGKVGDDIITLRPHQANAVWRMVQSGTTLLDHVVGAGKTFTMIAGIMEMRRMGLANKPMLVVPNHLVGQWGVDFIKLYPGANILVATKKDFEKDNRKRMFARIATGDWDAVIVAHSSFGKVEVEPEFQERFIKQQISDMDTSIAAMRAAEGKGSRNVKQIEKQKAALEEKLKRLFDTGAKDDNLYFSELGVDAVFLDEAHEFKNLGFSTGMQRVAGLGNPTGSQKAADLFMKVQSVLKRTGGRNVVFATGTPISNTMAEMYTMQRYLDYDTLKAQGIAHFDAWAKTFGEVVTDWELSPSGQYKMNSRFAKFVNMPELMQRYQSFGDVINRDDINRQLAEQGKKLPVPKVKGGKPENVIVPRSDDQAQYIGVPMTYDDGREVYPESSLIWRSENLPKKAEKGADNMLKIMSDARKAALDMRLIDPSYPDNPNSKVNVAADNIKSIYDQWDKDKGTQLVFIDLSTPKGAAAKEAAALQELVKAAEQGDEAAQEKLDAMSPDELLALESGKFSVYDDLKAKLIAKGIPEKEIAFIHDANTEQQKEDLFGKVRSGRVRVLFGSTAKMGAGMNVQDRLVALHHLDAPWRPSDLEQREGRIIRQGNALYEADPENFEVSIQRYATKQTLDSRMWQTIEAKARFIEQVRKGSGAREVEDVAGEAANSAEMKAASSGNPLILEEMTLRQQIRKLENQQSEHDREQYRIRDRVRMLADSADRIEARAALSEQDAKKVPKKYEVKIGNQTFEKHGEAGEAILAAVDAMQKAGEDTRDIGSYGGFSLSLAEVGRMGGKNEVLLVVNGANEYQIEANPGSNATGLGLRLQNTVKGLEEDAKSSRETAAKNRADIPKLEGQIKPWGQGDELADAKARHAAIIDQLKPKKKEQPAAEGGETPAMSRSTGQGGQKIADTFRFASTILDGFMNPPNLEVVETIDDPRVPQAVRDEAEKQRKGGAKGTPEGFYVNGTVYLINSQLKTPKDVARVLFHESLGHYGLRGLFGDALTPILQEIVQRRKVDVIAKAKSYGLKLNSKEDMLSAAEEVLAEMAQERPNIGFVRRVIAAIRTWMRANVPGFADLDFSDSEIIRDYILPARAFVERGGQAGRDMMSAPAFQRAFHGSPHKGIKKFSTDKVGTGEGAQAYGWGLYFASLRDIAENYRRKLTTPDGAYASNPDDSIQVRVGRLQNQIDAIRNDDSASSKAMVRAYEARIAQLEKAGQLYEVDIPEDTDMLLWDKPLSEQNDTSLIHDIAGDLDLAGYKNAALRKGRTGEDLYHAVSAKLGGDKQASNYLASWGIKGIKYLDGTSRADGDGSYNYVVFDGDQVEIENVYFSRSVEPADTGLIVPEQGMLRKAQAAVQDNMNRVKQVQSRIEKLTGSKMPDVENYYGAETNRPGRIAARLEDVRDKMMKPLIERLVAGGYKMPQLSELLHAQHAKERNEAIAKINPDMPDGGSGMTNAQADEILAKYRDERELLKIAEKARQIARATLDLKLAYGLIDEDTYAALTERYQFYVPLKGDGEYGPKIKRAMGHDEREEFILENIARDYDQSVVVGEKNLARQSLAAMILENPDPELWSIGVPPKGRYVAGKIYSVQRNGRQVASFTSMAQVSAFLEAKGAQASQFDVMDSAGERVQSFVKPLQDNEVPVYLGGQLIRLQINDESLARQLRPLDQGRMNPILEGMRKVIRYLTSIYTGYSPYFILRNLSRDLLTGTVNITGNEGAAMLARTWANYPAASKALGQWATTKNVPQTDAGRYLKEYRDAGGKTGASWMSDLEQQAKDLQRLFDDAYGVKGYVTEGRYGKAAMIAGRKTVGGLAHVIEIANQTTENSLRLALFIAMRKQGVSTSEAARAAKTVTVDFDRKGTMTGAIGAIYMFFNPAVQSTVNALRTLTRGKHKEQAWAMLGTLVLLGFYAATQGMDDDEDRWLGEGWDTRSKIFMLNIGGYTIRIPLSLEFAPFYGMGVAMGEASRGQSKVAAAGHMLTSYLNAWFPLGGVYDYDSDNKLMDATQAFVPTVIKPGFESATNRNFFGGQIVPDNEFTKNKPDNLKMYRGTKNTVYDSAAQNIASIGEVLGAGNFENDLSKVSPETLKYLWRTYTGGIGQFVGDTVSVGKMKVGGTELEANDMPFVKDFVRNNDVRPIRGRYYDLADEAKAAITEFNQAKKAGDGEEMDKILADPQKSPMIGLDRLIKATNKAAAAMRDEMVEINADKTLTDPQKRQKLKEIEKDEERLYREAIKAFQYGG